MIAPASVSRGIWALFVVTVVACYREEFIPLPGGVDTVQPVASDELDSGEANREMLAWGHTYALAEATSIRNVQSVYFDVDSDGRLDLVTLFRFAGSGTGYHSRVVVFRASGHTWAPLGSIVAGWSGAWIADELMVMTSGVAWRGRVWRNGDPLCCPSADTNAILSIGDLLPSDGRQIVSTSEKVD